jgi:hypothetical protein
VQERKRGRGSHEEHEDTKKRRDFDRINRMKIGFAGGVWVLI